MFNIWFCATIAMNLGIRHYKRLFPSFDLRQNMGAKPVGKNLDMGDTISRVPHKFLRRWEIEIVLKEFFQESYLKDAWRNSTFQHFLAGGPLNPVGL